MPYQIQVKCNHCGKISYVTSNGSHNEIIDFNCPNCGKHGLIVAYDQELGHRQQSKLIISPDGSDRISSTNSGIASLPTVF